MAASLHAELDRQLFNEIAPRYFAKDQAEASRVARRHRLLQTLRAIPLPPASSVLEVGCGGGFAARYLEGRCGRYCGIDYAEQLIAYARQHNSRPGATFQAVSAEQFSADEPFDVVLMIGVLHHFDQMLPTLRHLVGLVRPGGWVVANEPHPGNPLVHAARAVRRRVDRSYSPDQRELAAGELEQLYRAAGLANIRIQPQGLFSTPLAEVVVAPRCLAQPLARWACRADAWLEARAGRRLEPLSWNLVAAGQRPA
jgi:SAM-dependent methyltransferase